MTNRFASQGDTPECFLPVVNAPFQFWSGVVNDARNAYRQRELLRSLVVRELRQRYRGSLLGWGWALIRPLVMLAVYGVAVGIFLGAGDVIPQFGVYLYTGLIAWGYFSTIVSGCIAALPANAGLINKAAFQKELLIVAVVVVAMIDLVIQGSVLIIAYAIYGQWPGIDTLWWAFFALIALTVIGVGLGLFLSATNVYFRDIGYLTDVALQVGFWAAPIIYSFGMVKASLASQPFLLAMYSANPAVPAVSAFRFALWPSAADPASEGQLMSSSDVFTLLSVSVLAGLLLMWLGQRYFARLSGSLAQGL